MLFVLSLYLFLIFILPATYFQLLLRKGPVRYQIIYGCLSLSAFLIVIIRYIVHPYHFLFTFLTLFFEFLIIMNLIAFFMTLIYQLFCLLFRRPLMYKVILCFVIIACVTTSFGYISHFHKSEVTYTVSANKVSSLEKLRIGMISDVHLGTGTALSDLEGLVNTFNQKNYDLVVLAGDVFDEMTPPEMIDDAVKILGRIQTKYGIYAVNGNHEHLANLQMKERYQSHNIQLLIDEAITIKNSFHIIGREDASIATQTTAQDLLQGLDQSLPILVLDHNPKRYLDALDYADLQLSGHTHAGQFFPVTLITSRMYDNDYGFSKKNQMSLLVSSGFGSWGFPIRFLTNCEYVDIEFSFLKN